MTEKEKNEAAAAGPRPLTIGGQVYLISPPTPSQMASLGTFLQKRRATPLTLLVNDPSFKLLPVQAQVEAAREAAKIQISGPQAIDDRTGGVEMMQPESLAYFAWLLARPNHPGLRLEDLGPHITEANMGQLFVELFEASGLLSLGETPGPVG